MSQLQNKVVLITGGGRGIGAAAAEVFVREGARVFIASRTPSELKATAEKIHLSYSKNLITPLVCDLSSEESIQQTIETVLKDAGCIDVLINNGGVLVMNSLIDTSAEEWDKTFSVNARGSFLTSKACLKFWSDSQTKGTIINFSSLGGLTGYQKFPRMGAYISSKYAIVGLTEALAVEGKPLGVTANVLAPGAVDTQMLNTAFPNVTTKLAPLEVAEKVLSLTLAGLSGVTGTVEIIGPSS